MVSSDMALRFLAQMNARRHSALPWSEADAAMAVLFRDGEPGVGEYQSLFSYFLTGFLNYRSGEGGRADYPGEPSHSAITDGVEGFARFVPLVAAWLASGRPEKVQDWHGNPANLVTILRQGLLAGSDPASPDYWGDPLEHRQLVVESADIALAVWLSRKQVWEGLAQGEKARLVAWLSRAGACKVLDTNWHLFPIIVHAVLMALNAGGDGRALKSHYDRIKTYYLGDGWFQDGPKGRVDFYNVWAFQYHLFWLDEILPGFDRAWIHECGARFNHTFVWLFSPSGFPILGRSIPYRGALPAPLVGGALRGDTPPGLARRALDATFGYFASHGALCWGTWAPGYWRKDYRLVDRYSGPASSLWSLRSLVLAFYLPESSEFWQGAPQPLPVEEGDFDFAIPAAGWRIVGERRSGEVCIHPAANRGNPARKAEAYALWRRGATWVTGWPWRPRNEYLKYFLPVYSSNCRGTPGRAHG